MKRVGQKVYNSAAWAKLRQAYMASRNWICERCGQPATIVHHKQYITADNVGNPAVTLNFDNLEALCHSCHNREHEHFVAQGRVIFDLRGDVVGVAGDDEFETARRAIQALQFNPPASTAG